MIYFFSYRVRIGNRILRIGKGKCVDPTVNGVGNYLRGRYGADGWNAFDFFWHSSEAAALRNESLLMDKYVMTKGHYPPWNQRAAGGGRQMFVKCKAYTGSGYACRNEALVGNYNYCGVHRR